MLELDEARRAFLLRAAMTAVAGAGVGAVPTSLAQAQQHHQQSAAQPAVHQHPPSTGHGAFLNADDAATVAAFTERLMPGAPGKPGALDAGVLNYIDLALAGAYAHLQDFYRRGLTSLEAYCQKTYKTSFVALGAARQDEVIRALETGKATEFGWPRPQAFFNTLRTHTIEGMFSDPIYGGNKDFAGWRLVGFPGAIPVFTTEDMLSKEAYAGKEIIGLQARAPVRRA
ncbi:MAG: gluconate 2-dehydrogenase subunit 3 family protein [Xanthobacteraceae bacterium]|nr:gluconate 2-dehydrogenase subunit 3 family protein [Xanthobacteraceae bacterium]